MRGEETVAVRAVMKMNVAGKRERGRPKKKKRVGRTRLRTT